MSTMEFIETCLPYWVAVGGLGYLVWVALQIIFGFDEEQNTEK